MIILKSKKGVSPLIATVLLLIVAIIVGVMVMSWGRAQLEEASECTLDVGLFFVELNNVPQVCYAGSGATGTVTFIVENGVAAEVEGLQLRIIGSKSIYTTTLPESYIDKGFSLMKTVPYDFNLFGNIRQVRLVPEIRLFPNQDPLFCIEQALTIEDIGLC